jgi:hypothetical protein
MRQASQLSKDNLYETEEEICLKTSELEPSKMDSEAKIQQTTIITNISPLLASASRGFRFVIR